MPTPLLPDQWDVMLNSTIAKYERGSWVDISLDLNDYPTIGRMIPQSGEDGGTSLKWNVQVSNTGTFRLTELFDTDDTAVKKLDVQAEVPWSLQTANMKFDYREDIFQGSPSLTQIVNQVDMRRHAMWNDFYEGMELLVWQKPATSTTDPRPIQGIPTFVVKSSTAAFGFNGTNPSGFSSGYAGISSSTYSNWANGTATYTTLDESDFLAKLREATVKCRFIAPHTFSQLDKPDDRWVLATTYPMISAMEDLAKAQNDNIGRDLGKYVGMTLFRGTPFMRVPALDESSSDAYDSSDPVYGLNLSTIKLFFRTGINKKMSPLIQSPGQHACRESHLDNSCQLKCINRRRNFVISRAV